MSTNPGGDSALLDAMQRTVTVRPSKRPTAICSDRAQARLIRQKIIEHEQEIEDLEALKITPEELHILHQSFASVKAEFSDLDGLSWDTPSARQILINWHAQQAACQQQSPSRHSPGGLRIRGPISRPSLASLNLSSHLPVAPPSSPITSSSPSGRNTSDVFSDETVRSRPITPSPSRPDAGDDLERTPLPRLFPVPPEADHTPRPSLDDTDDNEPFTPLAPRPTLPKSHSMPAIPLVNTLLSQSPSRPTKSLPSSRIPVARSKSLSAKLSASSTMPITSVSSEFTFSTPECDRASPRLCRSNDQRYSGRADSCRAVRSVLANSPTINQVPTLFSQPDTRFETARPSSSPSVSKRPVFAPASPTPTSKRAKMNGTGTPRVFSDPVRTTLTSSMSAPALARTRATEGRPARLAGHRALAVGDSGSRKDGILAAPMSRTVTIVPDSGRIP